MSIAEWKKSILQGLFPNFTTLICTQTQSHRICSSKFQGWHTHPALSPSKAPYNQNNVPALSLRCSKEVSQQKSKGTWIHYYLNL